jgi:hypothetical protein
MAIAKPGVSIDNNNRDVFEKTRVLVPIIHDNEVNAVRGHGVARRGTISADPAFATLGQHQGFVANIGGRMLGWVNPAGAF